MSVLFGAFESPNASVDSYNAADELYGKHLTLARTYWNLDAGMNALQGLVDNKRTLIVSFAAHHWRYPNMTVNGIGQGVFDEVLQDLANGLKEIGALMYATFEHEPDLPGKGYTQGEWQTAYQRWAKIIRSTAPKVRTGPIFTGWFWKETYSTIRLGGYVNWVGVDPYCWPSGWQDPQAVMDSAIPPLVKRWPKRNIIVCETACDEDPRKPGWIIDLPRAVNTYPNIKGVSWFDVTKEHDWRLHSSDASLRAAQTMVKHPVWA